MKNEGEYVNQLKKLVFQMHYQTNLLDGKTKEMLNDATKWKCPDKIERILLDELINRAKEYIELEKKINETRITRDDREKYHTHLKWFNSVTMLVGTFDVPLKKLSFSDMSLKE